MKLNYIIASIAVAFAATACDSKLEVFEPIGDTFQGNPETVANVTAESLPGQIKLSWDDSNAQYEYLKIWYDDPRTKTTVTKLVSPSQLGKSEIILDNTRARYGNYTIHFQAFNANNKGGQVIDVVAKSDPAPTTIQEDPSKRTRHVLDDNQITGSNDDPTEGRIWALNDNNMGTFYHSNWHSPVVPLPHYLEVEFKNPRNAFQVWYSTRQSGGGGDGFPTAAVIQVNPEGTEDWVNVGELSDLPAQYGVWYECPFFYYEKPFKKFRFVVTAASKDSPYFHMSGLDIYDVVIDVFNPETDEEEVEPVK